LGLVYFGVSGFCGRICWFVVRDCDFAVCDVFGFLDLCL